jgi:hypothetical protein
MKISLKLAVASDLWKKNEIKDLENCALLTEITKETQPKPTGLLH